MALITSDCDAMPLPEHQMALITSDRVPFRAGGGRRGAVPVCLRGLDRQPGPQGCAGSVPPLCSTHRMSASRMLSAHEQHRCMRCCCAGDCFCSSSAATCYPITSCLLISARAHTRARKGFPHQSDWRTGPLASKLGISLGSSTHCRSSAQPKRRNVGAVDRADRLFSAANRGSCRRCWTSWDGRAVVVRWFS